MLLYFVTYYLLAGLGVNLGYHRVLSHRALRVPVWLERILITIGAPAGTPLQWAGNHRFHHGHADKPTDPHSPHHGGMLHAHVGWYLGTSKPLVCILYSLAGPLRLLIDAWLRPRTNQEYNYLAPDVAADPYYSLISRPLPYALLLHVHAIIAVGIAYWAWGSLGLLLAWVTFVILYNLGDAVDSVLHVHGDLPPGQGDDQARNHRLFGWLILGEGWHANHHRYPWSARHGLRPGQFDWTWQVIRLLGAAGLATDVKTVSEVAAHGPDQSLRKR